MNGAVRTSRGWRTELLPRKILGKVRAKHSSSSAHPSGRGSERERRSFFNVLRELDTLERRKFAAIRRSSIKQTSSVACFKDMIDIDQSARAYRGPLNNQKVVNFFLLEREFHPSRRTIIFHSFAKARAFQSSRMRFGDEKVFTSTHRRCVEPAAHSKGCKNYSTES